MTAADSPALAYVFFRGGKRGAYVLAFDDDGAAAASEDHPGVPIYRPGEIKTLQDTRRQLRHGGVAAPQIELALGSIDTAKQILGATIQATVEVGDGAK